MDEEDGKIGFRLPSGYLLGYQDLQKNSDGEFSYKTRNGRTKIYGGKVVENVVQALARCVVGEQMVKISEQYRPILTVHDAVAIIAPEDDPDARAYVEKCMKTAPAWAKGLPVNCESKVGYRYGKK
jgi:DNA polymerase